MSSGGAKIQPPSHAMDGLTRIELTWIENQVEFWIRFGKDVEDKILDRRRRVLGFAHGSINVDR